MALRPRASLVLVALQSGQRRLYETWHPCCSFMRLKTRGMLMRLGGTVAPPILFITVTLSVGVTALCPCDHAYGLGLKGHAQPAPDRDGEISAIRASRLLLAATFRADPHSLVSAAMTGTDAQRKLAFAVAREMRDPILTTALGEIAVGHPDDRVRVHALSLIGWIGPGGQSQVPCILVKSPDSLVRAAAFAAVGLTNDLSCLADVLVGLRDVNSLARLHAAIGAANLARLDGESEILAASSGEDQLLRMYAIDGLAALGTPAALERLQQVVSGELETWKTYAELGIEKVRLRRIDPERQLRELALLASGGARLISDWAVEELLKLEIGRLEEALLDLRERDLDRANYVDYLMSIREMQQ